MPEVVFPLDSTKKFTEQRYLGHNRWHPDIPTEVTGPSTTTTPPTTSGMRLCRPCTS
jgi:hypothetical protein